LNVRIREQQFRKVLKVQECDAREDEKRAIAGFKKNKLKTEQQLFLKQQTTKKYIYESKR